VLEDKRSYIFKDKQMHLHDQLDRDGKIVAEFWTTADAPGKHFGGKKPLYLLVNERTRGAAEAFAYDLQQYVKRAVVWARQRGDARVAAKQRVSRQLQT
jgi:C-terminal processing protease CtpA/Prc